VRPGEPGGWPHVSSSFGAIDLAGFQKPPAWWYRSVWLSNVSAADPGRVDLAMGLLPQLQAGFFQQALFRQKYICLMRQGHPLARRTDQVEVRRAE
jgi:hypothetical protein